MKSGDDLATEERLKPWAMGCEGRATPVRFDPTRGELRMTKHNAHSFTSCAFHELFDMVEGEIAGAGDFDTTVLPADYFELEVHG